MLWKIFAWVNLIILLPAVATVAFASIANLALVNILVLTLNDIVLLVMPFLLAYQKYDFVYLPKSSFLKMIFIFTIFYNGTNFLKDFSAYDFTSWQGLVFDLTFVVLAVLSIVAFARFMMNKYNQTMEQIFFK